MIKSSDFVEPDSIKRDFFVDRWSTKFTVALISLVINPWQRS